MRNLVSFFWKYQFTLFFLLFETVAFVLIVQSNKFHKARFLNATSAIAGSVYEAVDNITEYFELKRINKELAAENAKLQSMNMQAFIKFQGDYVSINDTLYKQQYIYLGAKVVNSSNNRRNNFLILNRGSDQGVAPEMGVICAAGVVGVVRDVSPGYCSVISVLHKETRISAQIKKNNYYGILEWDGKDPGYAILKDIPRHVEIKKGDAIITRGSSAMFPAGIPIAAIAEFEKVPGSNFYDIRVKLSTDFSNVAHVYIIRNLMKQEQLELEEAFMNEDD